MNKSFGFGIAKRLYLVSGLITAALIALALYAHFSLNDAAAQAEHTKTNRVPQLQAMAELELNVTQVSLQIRHSILARNPQELNDTLNYIGDKRKHMVEVLAAFEKRLFSPEGKAHFVKVSPAMAAFWKDGEANIALIKEGKKDEAFAYLVDKTIPTRNVLLKLFAEENEMIDGNGVESERKKIYDNLAITIAIYLHDDSRDEEGVALANRICSRCSWDNREPSFPNVFQV